MSTKKKIEDTSDVIDAPDVVEIPEQTEDTIVESTVQESSPEPSLKKKKKLKNKAASNTGDDNGIESGEEMPEEPDLPRGVKKLKTKHYDEGHSKPAKETAKKPMNLNLKWQGSWFDKNWKTIMLLMVIFSLGMFMRAYFGLEPATEDGFLLSGGSDSYYHHFVITNAQETGDLWFWDDMLNYPVGTRNPRPPLYDWSVYLGGIALTPFFGGDNYEATWYVFIFSTAFWGALTIVPTYLLASEVFGKKTGYIAAFLLAIMPGHIQRSVLTNADHDAFALFFIVLTFYFFLKSLKGLKEKTWVKDWMKMDQIRDGVPDLIRSNKNSILFAMLAAISLAAVALTWKGYAYVIVILTVYLLIQLLMDRLRNVDSLGVLMIYFISVGLALLLVYPYYYQSLQIASWFDTPTYILLAAVAIGAVLVVTRKLPWLLVIAGSLVLAIITVFVMKLAIPETYDTIMNAVASGAGYFVRNKQYETIAEAQAPPFSNLALSFGLMTFWLSFIGVAWAAYQLPKRMKFDYIFMLVWTATSIYMAINAARFMFNAAPVFAVTAAWVTALIIEKLDFREFIETQKRLVSAPIPKSFRIWLLISGAVLLAVVAGLSTNIGIAMAILVVGILGLVSVLLMNTIAELNPNRTYYLLALLVPICGALVYMYGFVIGNWELTTATHAFILGAMLFIDIVLLLIIRKSKISFVAGVLFLAFFIILPNVWTGIDAGIPYETKLDYDKQVYETMPLFLQPESYDAVNGTNWYFGAFGYSLPLNSKYYPAAYDWLATQDADIYPPEDRPAYLSWWDYGFEAVNEGKHPTVADNFLGGHQLAGNFIMAQGEADAIGLLITRLIEADRFGDLSDRNSQMTPEMITLLDSYGLDSNRIADMLDNPDDYKEMIWANPDVYSPRDDVIQSANARYLAIRGEITQNLDLDEIVSLYSDITDLTGDSIRYFAIDSRLFPFSAQNTGIFYAPAKLSDHRITGGDEGNQPYDFWQIKAVGEFGGEYDLSDVPPDVNLDPTNPYKIAYQDMFYNSMLYKAFVGYSGEDVGMTNEDGGIPAVSPSMTETPIMPAWNMTHFKLEHRTAYWNPYSMSEIQNHTDAWEATEFWDAYEKQLSGNGISDLSDRSSMYQGVMILKYYDGAIVSGTVTLDDGTPVEGAHVTVHDNFDIPHHTVTTDVDGKYSLIVPYDDIKVTVSYGELNPLTLIGSELNSTKMFIEDYQAMREKVDKNGDGVYDYLINHDVVIPSASIDGMVYWDNNDDGSFIAADDEAMVGAEVTITSNDLEMSITGTTDEYGRLMVDNFVPGSASIEISYAGRPITTLSQAYVSGPNEGKWGLEPTPLAGTVNTPEGEPVIGAEVEIWIRNEESKFTISGDNGSFEFDNLLYGDYLIQATYEGQASQLTSTEIKYLENNTITLTLEDSIILQGTISLPGGKAASQANLRVTFGGGDQYDVLLVTDDDGYFDANLGVGVSMLYCSYPVGDKEYVYSSRMELFNNMALDIELVDGVKVKGEVSRTDVDQPGINQAVYIKSVDDDFLLTAISNDEGTFSINVPPGIYDVYSSAVYDSSEFVYASRQTFNSNNDDLPISLAEAFENTMVIYRDIDGDGFAQEGEGLEGVVIYYKLDNGQVITSVTDSLGISNRSLYTNVYYTIEAVKTGYHSIDLGRMSHTQMVAASFIEEMVPEMVSVDGVIYQDDELLLGENAMIQFTSAVADGGIDTTVQMETDGTFTAKLVPGVYAVNIEKNITQDNDTVILQIDDEFVMYTGLNTGSSIKMNLTVKERVKFNTELLIEGASIAGNISFTGPEFMGADIDVGGMDLYLVPGDYIIQAHYADGEDIYMECDVFNISAMSELPISLKPAFELSGLVSYGTDTFEGHEVMFTDLSNDDPIFTMTDENSQYSVYLVSGKNYRVDIGFISYQEEAGTTAYEYYLNADDSTSNVTVSTMAGTMAEKDLTLQREEFFIDLSGNITLVDDATSNVGTDITFRSEDNTYHVTSDANGHYETLVLPGSYVVYVHNSETNDAYMDSVNFGVYDTIILNISLEEGYGLSGEVYFNLNQNKATMLDFHSEYGSINITTEADGHYNIWLPEGTYDVIGELTNVENDIDVLYALDTQVELVDDLRRNLPMEKVEVFDLSISSKPLFTGVVSPTTVVEYEITVENLGNAPDTYDLLINGGGSDWSPSVSEPRVEIDFGDKYTFTAKFTVTEDSLVNHDPVIVTVASSKSPGLQRTTNLDVSIKQTYGLEVGYSSTPLTMDGRSLKWNVDISNIGNDNDDVTAYIVNLEELRTNGWNVTFGNTIGDLSDDRTEVFNVSIPALGKATIPVILEQISDNPFRTVSLVIGTNSLKDTSVFDSESLSVSYPVISMDDGNITISGDSVYDTSTEDPIVGGVITIIAVSFGLLMFYVMKKKRWLR